MAVKIRLQRHGSKKRPFYFIVVADGRSPRDGKFIQKVGTYNPLTVPATIQLDRQKALEWLNKGAQPTDTVRRILSFKGVLYLKHLLRGVKLGLFDEAAAMDGANDLTIFWKIMFPMLRPVTATVAIVNALWIWNDFLLPRLVLTQETQTLPLSTYLFYGQYSTEYGQAMAGLLLAVLPIIIFYLILQRQFISGISTGAVK